jgi:hypothetical protein
MTDRGVLALPVFRTSLFLALVFALVAFQPGAAKAQVVERGVVGAGVGAIIGGIAGGRRGAGTGALIGGGIGVISGAAEANARQQAYERQYYGPPPPRAYGGGGLVYDIQAQLTRLGYDPGPVDGAYGPRTADAISHYQYTNGLPVDGQPSPRLLRHMTRYGG